VNRAAVTVQRERNFRLRSSNELSPFPSTPGFDPGEEMSDGEEKGQEEGHSEVRTKVSSATVGA
jgi:hypothetical protein